MHRSLQGRSSHGQLYKSQSQLSLQQSQQQRGDGNVNQDEVREQLQFAARIVDDRLGKDSKVAALQDVITGKYSQDYAVPPSTPWEPFVRKTVIPMTDELYRYVDMRESECKIGVFPDIERVWITGDDKLLLWDYNDGQFNTFEELSEKIVSVGLAHPKAGKKQETAGIFTEGIEKLLVICTPTTVYLVGIGFQTPTTNGTGAPGPQKELCLYLTPLSAPTERAELHSITSTPWGRIFMVGQTGCLYELDYRSEEGWFKKSCELVNVTTGTSVGGGGFPLNPSRLLGSLFQPGDPRDPIRTIAIDPERDGGVIYALHESTTIAVYSLGRDGRQTPTPVAYCENIRSQAISMCPNSPMLDSAKFAIAGLSILSPADGGSVSLVVTTSMGVRLFFAYQTWSRVTLTLIHVRLPPSNIPNRQDAATGPGQPHSSFGYSGGLYGRPLQNSIVAPTTSIALTNVSQGLYTPGGLFLAAHDASVPGTDLTALFVSAPDVGRINSALTNRQTLPFIEWAGNLPVEGASWSLEEVGPKKVGTGGVNELSVQVTKPRREFLVLTSHSVHIVVRQAPVDVLTKLLQGASGKDQELLLFAESFGRDQTCAMCLQIASGSGIIAAVNHDTPASQPTAMISSTSVPNEAVNQAKRLLVELGGRPHTVERPFQSQAGLSSTASSLDGRTNYSGRHEALSLHFARLIRSIWKTKVAVPRQVYEASPDDAFPIQAYLCRCGDHSPTAANPSGVAPAMSDKTLMSSQKDLIALRTFVENESQLFTLMPDQRSGRLDQEAVHAEYYSLSAIRALITQSVEAISFILLLIDYKMTEVVASCPPDVASSLTALTFEDLVVSTNGRDVVKKLVSAIINRQIRQQVSIDAISNILQQRCGSFCSADDVVLYKAFESLRRSQDTLDESERRSSLQDALRLFLEAARQLSPEKVKTICEEFRTMHFAIGAIDLALACANEFDRDGRALAYFRDGCPPGNPNQPFFERRKECYDCVIATLEYTDKVLNDAVAYEESVATSSKRPSTSTPALTVAEADQLRSNAYARALQSDDELFHTYLYDWYLSRGLSDQLLEVRTPYIEGYLSRPDSDLERRDLLWQYYSRIGSYGKAASVLQSLAELTDVIVPLSRRLEYLSLAVSNAKSQYPTANNRYDNVQFLASLEEKLEVAQVQVEIYRVIQEDPDIRDEERDEQLSRLDERLYNVTELFHDFARPYDMSEVVLLILHVSEHRDPALVMATWEKIIAKAQQDAGDSQLTMLAAKLMDTSRRFYPSDVFPLGWLVNNLEKISYENRDRATEGWVPTSLKEGGVPYDAIFEVMDELFCAKIPPWQTQNSLSFLIRDITRLLEMWYNEQSSSRTTPGGASYRFSVSPSASSDDRISFPAQKVDDAIGRYVASLGTGAVAVSPEVLETRRRLEELQRGIRRRF